MKVIIEEYLAGASLRQVAKKFNCTTDEVRDVLRYAGVASRPAGFPPVDLSIYDPTTLAHAVTAYEQGRENMSGVARMLNITPGVARTVLTAAGVRERTPRLPAFSRDYAVPMTPDMADDIVEAYRHGVTGPRLARHYGIGIKRIYGLLKARGVPRRADVPRQMRPAAPTPPPVAAPAAKPHPYAAIIDVYTAGGVTIGDIAARFQIPYSRARSILKDAGVEMRQGRRRDPVGSTR